METIKAKLEEVRKIPTIIEDIKENYDMGLITLTEFLGQLNTVNEQYKDLLIWFADNDISQTALSYILEH